MSKPNLRLPVSLTEADNELLLGLRSAMEAKNKRRTSLAEVVREALRALAKQEYVDVKS